MTSRPDKVLIYRSRRGMLLRTQWRASVLAPNGKTLFKSSESYNNVDDLLKIVDRLFPSLPREGEWGAKA